MDSKARQPSEASLASRARKRIWDNPYSVLAFASLCWSGNHIVGRAITGHIPPLTISTDSLVDTGIYHLVHGAIAD